MKEPKPDYHYVTKETIVQRTKQHIDANDNDNSIETQPTETPVRDATRSRSQTPQRKLPATTPTVPAIIPNEVNTVDKPTEEPRKRTTKPKVTTGTDDETTKAEGELFQSTIQTIHTNKQTKKNVNEAFIATEREDLRREPKDNESPDGGYISKNLPSCIEPQTPDGPTYRKKGLSRRETFEERCRQILGMENDGDTQGIYTKHTEIEQIPTADDAVPVDKKPNEITAQQLATTTAKQQLLKETIEVKIEDCADDDDDDDEPLTIKHVKKSLDSYKKQPTMPAPHITVDEMDDDRKDDGGVVLTKHVETKIDRQQQQQQEQNQKIEKVSKAATISSTTTAATVRPTKKETTDEETEPETIVTKPDTINVNEETTIVLNTRSSKSPLPKRRESTSPKRRESSSPKRRDSPVRRISKSPIETTRADHVQEHFVTEKVIDCKGKAIVEKTKQTPSSKGKQPTSPERLRNRSPVQTHGGVKSVESTQPSRTKPIVKTVPEHEPKVGEPCKSTKKPVETVELTTDKRRASKPSAIAPVKTTTSKPEKDASKPISKVAKSMQKTSEKFVRKPTEAMIIDAETVKTTKTTKKPSHSEIMTNTTTTTNGTIKDRLRSSPRKQKPKTDDVDGGRSSSETSPTRYTDRRRSSNISVHTEIIIDHAGPRSPKSTTTTVPDMPTRKSPQQPAIKDTVSSPAQHLEKVSRRFPVTERKESAPVQRVTRRDKDLKMARSSSENIIKVVNGKSSIVKKTEMSTLTPNTSAAKPDRRPSKCFTTKTINLSTTDKFLNSDDMESVIIDIQHAKSSREPSPDKIVPTPVPINLETGKPRYPDVVQEPEDEPRKKPVVKNIPIFEEESNGYIGCHISEINIDQTHKKTSEITDRLDDNDFLDNPTVEAPKSLDYPTSNAEQVIRPDDDCLLSVHEKVTKFTNTAEDVKRPKVSTAFSREFDHSTKVSQDDECLLTINQKVDKFLKTAESITKQPVAPQREIERPSIEEIDEELRNDECILSVSQKVNKFIDTAEKLALSAPQKSPRLVANIERNISRQSEPELESEQEPESELEREQEPEDLNEPNDSVESEVETISSRVTKKTEENQRTERHHRQQTSKTSEKTKDRNNINYSRDNDDDDDDALTPMTKTHTTAIELKRQKDILSRSSVFGVDKKSPSQPKPNKFAPTSFAKPETKPTTVMTARPSKPREVPASKSDNERNVLKTYQTTTVATAKTRFENAKPESVKTSSKSPAPKEVTKPRSSVSPKRKPATEYTTEHSTIVDSQTTDSEVEVQSSSKTTKTYRESTVQRLESEKINRPRKISHSPTRSTTSPSKSTAKTTVTKTTFITEHNQTKPTQTPIQTPIPTPSPTIAPNHHNVNDTETIQTILEQHSPAKPVTKSGPRMPQSQPSTTTTTMASGKTRVANETVAARRNIFEHNGHTPTSPKSTHKTTTPTQIGGRRPSYMDYTKSALEHIRRDSLEINKNNYSRKSSVEDETAFDRNPNSAVKFDVPKRTQRKEFTSASISEDVNIEEIFELEVLEQMLEIVTSYELRRRIRAQIRLIKKNMINSETKIETSNNISMLTQHHKSSTSHHASHVHHEETDNTINTDTIDTMPKTKSYPTTNGDNSKHYSPTRKPIDRIQSPNMSRRQYHKTEEEVEQRKEEIVDRRKKPAHDRSHSPDAKTISSTLKEVRRVSGTAPQKHVTTSSSRQATIKQTEKVDHTAEHTKSTEEAYTSDERSMQTSTHGKPPLKPRDRSESPVKPKSTSAQPRERSCSPKASVPSRDHVEEQRVSKITTLKKTYSPERRRVSQSPTGKSPQPRDRSHSPQATKTPGKQQQQRYETMTTKTERTTKTATHSSPERRSSKVKPDEKTPIWADRRNVLKNQSARKEPAQSSLATGTGGSSRNTASKTVRSTFTSSTSSNRQAKATSEEDSITSSYGIGPTDENGFPLFGIRALKTKKKQTTTTSPPCEATEEVTGYVIEEKYYSDNKTKPIVERKELIYSTNADELEQLQRKVETRRSSNDEGLVVRAFKKINNRYDEPLTITGGTTSGDDSTCMMSTNTSKYVRRGSVKEMSEKLIRKESSQSMTEKSSGYPKAGLILRTNTRSSTKDVVGDADELRTDDSELMSIGGMHSDIDIEHSSSHMVTESESESESVSMRRKEHSSSQQQQSSSMSKSTRSQSTRSFLNTSGESRIVTGMDDVLERMRNADNVVEPGDTAEDQEARALLNKFLGASVIMQGVESIMPVGQKQQQQQKQSKQSTTTTTTTTNNYRGGDNYNKEEAFKTTRVTKTIKSANSSTPVTSTTCDIEEIWDEEILKQLLEQSSTYEERRKIRARLRELMAEREALQQQQQQQGEEQSTSTTEHTETKENNGSVVTTTTKVTTRTVTGTTPKKVSPFAKFQQLDKKNSQQSSKMFK